MVHFQWDITLGQILLLLPLLGLFATFLGMYNQFSVFRMEHEVLMEDWAHRQSPQVKLEELPWRKKR